MASCCEPSEPEEQDSCCGSTPNKKSRPDILLWSTFILVSITYLLDLFAAPLIQQWKSLATLSTAVRRWKIAFFLPLVTVPQVVLLS